MTRFKKILLAGTATFALMAAPAMAIDALNGATSGVSGAATGVTGSTSGAAGAGSSIDPGRTVGGAGGSVGVGAGAGAGSNGASAGAGVTGAGNVGDNSLTGQTGITGAFDTPSPAQTESNVRGAAEAARETTQGMTGGAAAGVSGKGAVSADTEADDNLGDGASLPNAANDTLAQVGGTGGAMDTLGSGGTTSPANTGVTGTTGGSTDRIVGDEGAGSAAGGAAVPEIDPTSELTGQGYTNIKPVEGAAATEGQAIYSATNADGEPVEVTVDSRTGAVISETGADAGAKGTMEAR
ncbi:filamentous haemagglutinin family outer membrane protein [Parvibaculum lavamentivorans DS-1]|uniref:Filamentous haemagglutinin family outer membrane protein n=1 Tax=Parvibaculum lavamentivorans (strain DS-1 / DSM 13023 / NCIMB 13966) TaxID=402881 RepID=A7HXU2_PARL1|nr:hypothetical protein [Parvibaculum lavamentivorans]ABS64725.1 filamentous haemagglutinin family outer membrane protein [Parvibaculum lavamentivorans DS-1]